MDARSDGVKVPLRVFMLGCGVKEHLISQRGASSGMEED